MGWLGCDRKEQEHLYHGNKWRIYDYSSICNSLNGWNPEILDYVSFHFFFQTILFHRKGLTVSLAEGKTPPRLDPPTQITLTDKIEKTEHSMQKMSIDAGKLVYREKKNTELPYLEMTESQERHWDITEINGSSHTPWGSCTPDWDWLNFKCTCYTPSLGNGRYGSCVHDPSLKVEVSETASSFTQMAPAALKGG